MTDGGRIITFYSYKGGTGRSMAVANVAWLLACSGKRVLVIDWDLEAPGVHRYFEPFLSDTTLQGSGGLIDFCIEFSTAAVTAGAQDLPKDWYLEHANLLTHAVSLDWEFPGDGLLDFVPAGKQDVAYPLRVNSFNWQQFYEKLGGGVLLEEVKKRLRPMYDFVIIDSRTGLSDTSGICTVQMPDDLVVCFTFNRQSIYGSSAAAASVHQQRRKPDGTASIRIWPVPMRTEYAEKERLERARILSRVRFSGVLDHLDPDAEDKYWGKIEVAYQPFYAYEETLASFVDLPRQTRSLLSSMETIAAYISDNDESIFVPMDEGKRTEGRVKFSTSSAWGFAGELKLLSEEYERIRKRMDHGPRRTYLMTGVAARAQALGGQRDAGRVAEFCFNQGSDGSRIVGLVLARKEPQRAHIDMALAAISDRRSAFEQYHALLLAKEIAGTLDPSAAQHLSSAISEQLNKTITSTDKSRWSAANDLLTALSKTTAEPIWSRVPEVTISRIGSTQCPLVSISPPTSFARYNDVNENHGPFVVTRGSHTLQLTRPFRMSQYLVTNETFLEFVKSAGYKYDEFWRPKFNRARLLTGDGETFGPSAWPSSHGYPEGEGRFPVVGLCLLEAEAFAKWCNRDAFLGPEWVWSIPNEDMWEFAARTESGLTYPWGDSFDAAKCNSEESKIGRTTEVTRFASGSSRFGCCDMAGNAWEFVLASDTSRDLCVLRGGSYKNNRFQVRTYLRLIQVPISHRPPDFGFRLAQVEAGTVSASPKSARSIGADDVR